jgi:HlyD family secretion protein
MKDKKWIFIIGAVVAVGAVLAFGFRGGAPNAYITAKVQRGAIHDVVEATGTVNAVITVQVGSQVSGTIARLYADFNSHVRSGEVVASIDPALFRGAMQQATADLESAQANVLAMQANVDKARALVVQTKAEYDRAQSLVKSHFESQQVVEVAKANYDSAVASVAAALAAVEQARAQVRQKQAAVAVAQTNLDYTEIRSPIDGVVVARNVDVGQTVAASLQAPTLFNIAQDLTKMQLYAKTDESEVGRIKAGQEVTFKVDAYPKQQFRGTVRQIRMNATTVQNVVTYDTVIDFDNADLKLFPGMTAYVTIPVVSVEDVVRLPNTALRFEPPLAPDELKALYARYGVSETRVSPAMPGKRDDTARAAQGDTAVVWKLHGSASLEPVEVVLGITDHAYTQVVRTLKGSLQPDDDLVTAALGAKSGKK